MAGNRIFLFGGYGIPRNSAAAVTLPDLWVYNVETGLWLDVTAQVGGLDKAPWPRRGHTAMVVGDRLEIFSGCTLSGGEVTGCFNDLSTLDIENMAWSRPLSKGIAPEVRGGSKGLAIGRTLMFFGGCDEKKTCFADINTARLSECLFIVSIQLDHL
jgi:N-acetylneuraminic acid mutarotase